jgi:Protein of unknown function (DUF2934)
MANKSVFCIARTDQQAIEIVGKLKSSGFRQGDISVLFPDKQGTRDFAHEQHTKAPEGVATGATTGGALGAALGWLAGMGALAIPGVGPFIAAGPLLAALSGGAVGAALGGIAGALVGMGIPEYEAKRYEGKIKGGNVLISVHTENNDMADRAQTIFKQAGAEDISSAGEVAVRGGTSGMTAASARRGAEMQGTEARPRPRKNGGASSSSEMSSQSGRAPAQATVGSGGSGTGSSRGGAGTSGMGTGGTGTSGAGSSGMNVGGTGSSSVRGTGTSGTSNLPTREEIAARAYQIYLRRGRVEGRDTENWLAAEAELVMERRGVGTTTSQGKRA